jgi:hypothetical protein
LNVLVAPARYVKSRSGSLFTPAELFGGVRVDEVFWAWETNRRMGFSVTAASIGGVSAVTEVYEIEPLSSERCKLRWTFAGSHSGVLRTIEPFIARILPIVQERSLKKLEHVARERWARV